jgi:hypothetical protein
LIYEQGLMMCDLRRRKQIPIIFLFLLDLVEVKLLLYRKTPNPSQPFPWKEKG